MIATGDEFYPRGVEAARLLVDARGGACLNAGAYRSTHHLPPVLEVNTRSSSPLKTAPLRAKAELRSTRSARWLS